MKGLPTPTAQQPPLCHPPHNRQRPALPLAGRPRPASASSRDRRRQRPRRRRRLSKTSECLHRFNLHIATPIPIVPVIRRLMCICMRTMVENWGNEGPAYSNGPATATLPPATQPPTAGSPSGGPLTSGLCLKPASLDLQRAFFPGAYGHGNSWLFRALKFNDFELSNAIAAVRSIATSKPITSTTAAASSSACPSPKPYQLWLIYSPQPPLTGAS